MCNLLSSLASTLIGGTILALLFFLVREKVFPIPDISGKWKVISQTNKSAYSKFENMELRYTVILWCEGTKIYGTSEKTSENSSAGAFDYVGPNRVRGEIGGVILKRIFSKDKIKLHIVEHGEKRDSTIYYDLVIKKDCMTGTLLSTAGDSKGTVNWQRDKS